MFRVGYAALKRRSSTARSHDGTAESRALPDYFLLSRRIAALKRCATPRARSKSRAADGTAHYTRVLPHFSQKAREMGTPAAIECLASAAMGASG